MWPGPLGVNLRDLFPPRPVPEGWYAGKRVAVDGHNTTFRYLTSIRGRDGDVLRNGDGRVTGHLYGLMGLVRHMRQHGAEPLFVWDGDVHPRKAATVQERIRRREEAKRLAAEARERGDMATYARLARGTVHLDGQMIEDASRLLEAVGVAVLRADHDGERYAAALVHAGHADTVASEDFDALVAGAPQLLRKAGGQAPFLLELAALEAHGLDRRALRHVAILCGTDWHPGVKGFGAKTAARFVRDHDIEKVWSEARGGSERTRYHKLLAKGGMDWETFQDLDAFVADLPTPEAPRTTRPCPEMASALSEEMGIGSERALACFC